MKILVVNQSPTFGGGASESLIDLINSIDKRFEIILMIPKSEVLIDGIRRKTKQKKIKLHSFTENSNIFAYGYAVLKFMYFLMKNKIDIFYMQDFGVTWKPAEMLAAKILGIPIVCHIRGSLPKNAGKSFLRLSKFVIGNSDFTLSSLRGKGLCLKRIYNSLNLEEFDSRKSSFVCKKGKVKIAYVGRARIKKGLMVYVKAASKILKKNKSIHFYVIGDDEGSSDGCLDEAKNFVHEKGLMKYFTFTGLVYDAPQIMKQMDIIAVPSIFQEPFGRVNIEAMAAGKALVASMVGGIPEVVEDSVTGLLVAPNDCISLADAIEKLIKDKKLRERLGVNGRRSVEKRFDSKVQIKEIENIFESAR